MSQSPTRMTGRRIRPRLTYANVVATLALFIALGGASYAAFHLPNNSVRSKNIVRGQVKRSDIGAKAITTGKIGRGQVTAAKLSPPENLHFVGTTGQPLFNSNTQRTWASDASGSAGVSFYKDQVGVVHLSGTALCGSLSGDCGFPEAGVMFTLPAGYVPPVTSNFLVRATSGTQGNVTIDGKTTSSPGAILVNQDNAPSPFDVATIALDGITFRGS